MSATARDNAASDGKAKLSQECWEQAALNVIANYGVAAVAVEPLAKELGVTKGSFYWHFSNREALIEAALKRWETEEVEALFAEVDAVSDPHERLRELFRRSIRQQHAHRIYAQVSAAADHPLAASTLRRVGQRVLRYLFGAFRATNLSETEARHRAQLTYAAYIGLLQLTRRELDPRMGSEQLADYLDHVMATLIPD